MPRGTHCGKPVVGIAFLIARVQFAEKAIEPVLPNRFRKNRLVAESA
jgi:hypothetical protein